MIMEVVSRTIMDVVTIVCVTTAKVSVEINAVSPVLPAVVHVQRIIRVSVPMVIAVPRAESPVRVAISVVVTKVVVTVARAYPEMIEGTGEIDNNTRPIAYVSTMPEVARRK
jgi:hypothetical protein